MERSEWIGLGFREQKVFTTYPMNLETDTDHSLRFCRDHWRPTDSPDLLNEFKIRKLGRRNETADAMYEKVLYRSCRPSPDVILCGWLDLKHQLTN